MRRPNDEPAAGRAEDSSAAEIYFYLLTNQLLDVARERNGTTRADGSQQRRPHFSRHKTSRPPQQHVGEQRLPAPSFFISFFRRPPIKSGAA